MNGLQMHKAGVGFVLLISIFYVISASLLWGMWTFTLITFGLIFIFHLKYIEKTVAAILSILVVGFCAFLIYNSTHNPLVYGDLLGKQIVLSNTWFRYDSSKNLYPNIKSVNGWVYDECVPDSLITKEECDKKNLERIKKQYPEATLLQLESETFEVVSVQVHPNFEVGDSYDLLMLNDQGGGYLMTTWDLEDALRKEDATSQIKIDDANYEFGGIREYTAFAYKLQSVMWWFLLPSLLVIILISFKRKKYFKADM